MRHVIINENNPISNTNNIHSIEGNIKDDQFCGGDIEFSIKGIPELGYDFFFHNLIECEGYSLDTLPENLKEYLENLNFKGF